MRWMGRAKRSLGASRWIGEESGQSMIIVAGAIIALIAIMGLGVDLGVVYVERVNLARAMDAAALAGAQELPIEKAAHQRALEYLQANGYDTSNACIETLGSNLGGTSGSCVASAADTKIYIDTLKYRDDGEANTSSKITVRATQNVPLVFIRVVGINSAPISASATAENVDNLDIAIVYDRSGSMQEDTRCYGCWEPAGDYPAGYTFPLPFEIDPDSGAVIHCLPSDPLVYDGYHYISIEAEHYTRFLTEADYHRDETKYPKTWWAMQRQPNRNASGPDGRGAFMMVGPHSGGAMYYETLNDIQHPPTYTTTPRLDYDFTVPVAGTYYVWIRAQGGSLSNALAWINGRNSRRWVHVGLNGVPMNTGQTPEWGPYNDGANPDNWRWTRVLTLDNLIATGPSEPYTLNVWQAGQGFRLDKIVITNDHRGNLVDQGRPLGWDSEAGVTDAGPAETHGRTGWACMVEDPRFTPDDPVYGGLDDLYDDYQPIRAAKEAAKTFVRKMNPELDQVAYVTYSTESQIDEELYCKKRIGSCTDFENVAASIEATLANGNTNIAEALWDGIRVLSMGLEPPNDGRGFPSREPGTRHYGRSSAAHILVLMTDGQANERPTLPPGYGNCYSDDLWPPTPGETPDQHRARECVVWFAHKARDRGIVIYTIGLGGQADTDLLEHVAELTGGWYYYAPSAAELDEIFESLYERIFLRLTD